ncbi:hypothetical protein Xmau_03072 [Xenorhabdus mauleonii]|uniref:Uncharacterized protein n=1 Tax=Xenorhabdus mauleonii TaxID=351675 RepID=A0A1I3SHY9_9GAMM|nr:hypothetical protein [Xenorhabdus mauleonii]PHM39166.1 hypothetical protein Xmau_03072 [Xenorhabdus mauleonii]SFJ57369.1 hypothetical protein SAMN05421680_11193 [Xenorhabdus mauleonii]
MNNPISLKQAVYLSGIATSLFKFIFEKAKHECSIDLNNLITLASDINQEVHNALLKYTPAPLSLRLLNCLNNKRTISLDLAMHRAKLGTSLYEIILEQASPTNIQACSTELHNMLSLACDINQEVYHALVAVVYIE